MVKLLEGIGTEGYLQNLSEMLRGILKTKSFLTSCFIHYNFSQI